MHADIVRNILRYNIFPLKLFCTILTLSVECHIKKEYYSSFVKEVIFQEKEEIIRICHVFLDKQNVKSPIICHLQHNYSGSYQLEEKFIDYCTNRSRQMQSFREEYSM